MAHTERQFREAAMQCREIFRKKTTDYGTAWRVLRTRSLTDQLFIKAKRIRTLEEKQVSLVGEGIRDEFVGLVNYSVMALVQLELGPAEEGTMEPDAALDAFDRKMEAAFGLMQRKNHDYGEAWRDMRISSYTDLILMKLLRVKQIEDNDGQTLISEGLEANFFDIINYAIFALIKLNENHEDTSAH